LILWIILRRFNTDPSRPQRLIYVTLMAMVFVFLVIIVLYPPARSVLFTAKSLTERLRLLFLSNSEPPAELYQVVSASWNIPYIWIYLRGYDIFLAIAAGIEWAILLRRSRQGGELSVFQSNIYWLIILLPAFALQNISAVLSDITGSKGDISNLEIRLIPLTACIVTPLAASLILRLIRWFKSSSIGIRRFMPAAVVIVVPVFVFLGLVKGTSDPLLSNNWIFYSPHEAIGFQWLDQYIPRPNVDRGRQVPSVWVGPDFRLGQLWMNNFWGPNLDLIPVSGSLSRPYQYVFISPGVRLLTERYHQTLPDLRVADTIYDNGSVQIYYHLPIAP
jgi:hypothetical protein